MKRTTIMLPDDVDRHLRYEARRRGVSITQLAGEAIATYLAGDREEDGGREYSFFDLGEGDPDSGTNVDYYVAKAIEERFEADRT